LLNSQDGMDENSYRLSSCPPVATHGFYPPGLPDGRYSNDLVRGMAFRGIDGGLGILRARVYMTTVVLVD
jgi:hypothetical protein